MVILGWYIGSNLVQMRATGAYAKWNGVFWLLVLGAYVYFSWGLVAGIFQGGVNH